MYKVLITDDEVKVCRLILNVIDWEKLGLEVVGTANDGITALDMIQSLKPDIVITDIRMPGYDGLQLIEKAKETNPDIYFVIISGHREFAYAQSAIRFGVEDYLLKPLEEKELEEILTRMVQKKENVRDDIRKEETLRKRIEVDTKRIQKDFMTLLLDVSGSSFPLSIGEVNKEYHCNFRQGLFQVIVIKADVMDKEASTEAYDLLMSKAEKIASDGLRQDGAELLSLIRPEGIYILLNMDEQYEKDLRKRLKKIRLNICALRDLFWDIKATVGMGSIKADFAEIGASAQEARTAILNRLFLGLGHVIGINARVGKEAAIGDMIDYQLQTSIQERIEVLDIGEVKKYLRHIQRAVEENKDADGILLLQICETLIDILKFGLKKLGFEEVGESLTKDFHELFYRCIDVKDVFELLQSTFANGMEKVMHSKEEVAVKPIRTAQKYIQDHYQEPLKLDDISRMVGFNPNYFSSMFKKEIGQNFSEYLIQIRMSQAKQNLITEDMSIIEIAESVGYTDLKHFSKLFKKMTGLNPTEFRKLYQKLS